MREARVWIAAFLAAGLAVAAGGADAQSKKKSGGQKIICWKDKAGKVVGCGDSVPPEYQDNASKELDQRGITRRVNETAEERARREAEEKAQAAREQEEARKRAEQRRQDAALIHTFTNVKEIDLKRDRDLQVIESQIVQLRTMEKNATKRIDEMRQRIEAAQKAKRPVSDYNKDELARAESDLAKARGEIAEKENEQAELRARYAQMRKRYLELTGGTATAAAKK